MAQALDDAAVQLVLQRRRIQAARFEVCSPWNWGQWVLVEAMGRAMDGHVLGVVDAWANADCLTGPMTCSPRRTTLCKPLSSACNLRTPTTASSDCAALCRYLDFAGEMLIISLIVPVIHDASASAKGGMDQGGRREDAIWERKGHAC
jgi:hypothetical protein